MYFRLSRKPSPSSASGVWGICITHDAAVFSRDNDLWRWRTLLREQAPRYVAVTRAIQRSRERESVAAPLAWPKIGPSWRRVRARARQRRSLLALLCANTSSADLAPGPCVVGTAFQPRLRRGPVRPACNFTAALMPATGFPADGCGGVSPMTALLPSGSASWITAVFLRGLGCS